MSIISKNDLDLKYLVFKISDIKKYLSTPEHDLMWSFMDKIIKTKLKILDFRKSQDTAKELMLKQFKHDIVNLGVKTIEVSYIIELIEKYDL